MKRQGQIVAATITNFGAVEEALKNMENSAGSAEAEMETIRDSAEYAMNALKETFTSLAQHSVSRGGLKDLINAGTQILEIVDGIVSKIGLLPALISSIVGIVSAKSSVKSNLLSFSLNDKNKIGLNFLGAQVGKGWSERINALKIESIDLKNVVNDLINEMPRGSQESEKFQNAFTKAMASSNVAVRNLAEKAKNGTATIKDMDAATNSLDKSSRRAQIGVNLLNTALSVFVSMGISMVINSLIKSLNDATKSYENNINKVKSLSENIKTLEGDYSDLNKQLEESKRKLRELEKIPNPTLFDEAEIENLKEANKYLEIQIKLKQIELEQAKEAAVEAAKKTKRDSEYRLDYWRIDKDGLHNDYYEDIWNNKDLNFIEKVIQSGATVRNVSKIVKDWTNIIQGNIWWQQELLISNSEKALDKYLKAQEELNNASDDTLEKSKKNRDKAIDNLDEYISKLKEKYGNWQYELEALKLDPENNQARIAELEKAIATAEKIINYKNPMNGFLGVYNNAKFSDVTAQLEELAASGELTADRLKNATDKDIKGIEAFRKALNDVGITDLDKVFRSIIQKTQQTGDTFEESTNPVKDFTEALSELYDVLDDVISKQEKLIDSFKKIRLGETLTYEDIYALIKEMPSVSQYIEKTVDGYTISAEGFKKISEETQKQTKENIEKDLRNVRDQMELVKNRDELEKKKNELDEKMRTNNSYDMKLFRQWDSVNASYYNAEKACQGITESYEDLEEVEKSLIVSQELLQDVFDGFLSSEIYEDAKSKVYEYNKSIETLDNAIKTLNEQNLLSYDEMVAIIEIAPDLKAVYDEQGKGYSFVTSQIEEQRKKSLEARNEYINGLIEQAKTEIAAAESVKNACEIILNASNRLGTDEDRAKAQLELEIAQKRIEELEDTIKKFEALQGNLTTDDKKDDNSLADEMQRRIDYYNTILSAVEAVKNKYTEAIDTEIDALEEGKDALKEANDERQRELDLIEARNNLENAKKRKVWVYSEADGFKQVQDEKALKEAEEKYRDTIQEVQEAAIDKQIDALEKKKETVEKQVEDLTGLESDIQDNKKIAQAITALGLSDEKDLLNLSDSVKQGIKEGLTEAILTKEKEDNKDNNQHIPVTVDDILKHLGAKVTTDNISGLDNVTQSIFDNAAKSFAESLKEYADSNVSNVVNNNSGMVISPTFNISGVTDPQEVAKVVNSEMTNLFTRLNNSIK